MICIFLRDKITSCSLKRNNEEKGCRAIGWYPYKRHFDNQFSEQMSKSISGHEEGPESAA